VDSQIGLAAFAIGCMLAVIAVLFALAGIFFDGAVLFPLVAAAVFYLVGAQARRWLRKPLTNA
jgi:hypothetical protein